MILLTRSYSSFMKYAPVEAFEPYALKDCLPILAFKCYVLYSFTILRGFALSLLPSLDASMLSAFLTKLCIDLTSGGLAVLVLLLYAKLADFSPALEFVSAAEKL